MSLLPSFDDALTAPPTSGRASTQPMRFLVGGSFSRDSSASSSVDWHMTTQELISHSDGLCSSVYRRCLSSSSASSWPYDPTLTLSKDPGTSSARLLPLASLAAHADGLPGWICIKRVEADEQPRPHSIDREIALLDLLPPHRNLVPLLAAFHDTSDPFGAVVDLLMPLYAATLEEVLEEPTLQPTLLPSSSAESGTSPRPGSSIQHLWSESVPKFVWDVAKQLLSGIAFLHEHNVAHRDIKPSNVLLSHNGTLKIIDLGTAYTTTMLPSPLSSEQGNGARSGKIHAAGKGEEWTGGRMVCQVGTGVFRAPELLFSPVKGYDAFATDVWAAAVTLAHFFTELTAIPNASKQAQSDAPSLDVSDGDEAGYQDERKDWQKAFDSSTSLPSPTPSEPDSPLYWEENDFASSDPASTLPRTASGYIRSSLFQGERGDIGLAASIFALLGLPETLADWPEAEHFQPPLHRLPFAATSGKGLRQALPLFEQLQSRNSDPRRLEILLRGVITPALSLSASKRPTAHRMLSTIDEADNRH